MTQVIKPHHCSSPDFIDLEDIGNTKESRIIWRSNLASDPISSMRIDTDGSGRYLSKPSRRYVKHDE